MVARVLAAATCAAAVPLIIEAAALRSAHTHTHVGTTGYRIPPASLAPAPYAPWAHSHMVWLSSDRSNQANVTAYVADYLAHNISVGAVDIDSEWSTGNNNFIPDTTKFPNLTALVRSMHSKGINVILWATGMVDTDSSNYATGLQAGYYIRNGFNETALVKWWHGTGAFLDYFNPDARAWWESQLDIVLNMGIDGWKVDGTDPYLIELLTPLAYPYDNPITLQDYQNMYYGHFFNYTRQKQGPQALIWSRPVDSYPVVLNISAFLEFSPDYVMWSGWVGDQDPTFFGMKMALINILESAWRNYTNFGSDTGGYRSGVRTGELLTRWAQLNAFLPLFENGGNNEHRPWMYDSPGSTLLTDTYRGLVSSHVELTPYFMTTAAQAYEAGVSVITPSSPPPAGFPFILQPDQVDDYSYQLGANMFVSPIPEANVSVWSVTLPSTHATWIEYYNQAATHPGGSTFMYPCPLSLTPVFVAAGALIPLHVSTPLGLFPNADESWASALTDLLHTPAAGGKAEVRDFGVNGAVLEYQFDASAGVLQLTASPFERDIIFVLRGVRATAATAVTVDSCATSSLQRVAYAPAYPREFQPTALSWDTTSRQPHRPVDGLRERVEAAAQAFVGTWMAADAAHSAVGIDEVIVRVGSGTCGVIARLDGVTM